MMELAAQEKFGLGNAGGASIIKTIPEFKLGNSSLHFFVDSLTSIWKMFVFYYDTGEVSDLIDTGLDFNGGTLNIASNLVIQQSAGFMPVFYDTISSYYYAFFIDRDGILVDTIVSSVSPNYSTLNSLMCIYTDYSTPNATVKIFDGTTVNTHIFENTNLISSGGFSTGQITRDLSVPLIATTIGGEKIYIAKRDGSLIDITSVAPTPYSLEGIYAFGSHFDSIVCLFIDPITSIYTKIRVINTDGAIVYEENINAYNIQSLPFFEQYGTNKFGIVGCNFSNNAVDYLVMSYNSETNTLYKTTHPRGTTYTHNVISNYPSYQTPGNVGYDNFIVSFSKFNSIGPYYVVYDYFDIVWINKDSTGFQTSVITSGTTIGIIASANLVASEPCFLTVDLSISPIDITANFLPTAQIGLQSVSTGIAPTDVLGVVSSKELLNYSYIGILLNTSPNNVVWQIYQNYTIAYQTTTSNNFDNGFTFSVPGGGNLDTTIIYDKDSSGDSFSFAPLRQDSITPFTIGDVPSNDELVNFMTSGNRSGFNYGKQFLVSFAGTGVPRIFYLFDRIKGFFATINNNTCDPSGNFQYWLGETTLNYICQDASGFYNLFMYDLEDGSLLHTLNTGYTTYDNYEVYGDRIFFSYHDIPAGQYDYFFIGRGGTYQVVVPDIATDYSINDELWS